MCRCEFQAGVPVREPSRVGTMLATIALALEAASTYQVTVVKGSGPAGIATILTAMFRSSGTTRATLAAGTGDTLDVRLKIKGNTPTGTCAGTVLVTDQLTGITAGIPISVTHSLWQNTSDRPAAQRAHLAGGPSLWWPRPRPSAR